MRHESLSVLAVLCAAASLCAQVGESPPTGNSPRPYAPADEGGGLTRFRSVDELGPQEPDYSLRGLFQEAHGDFLLKRERYDPMVEVYARYLPSQKIADEEGRFDLVQPGIDAELPFMVSPDAFLLVGAYADARFYRTTNFGGPSRVADDETLHAIGVKLGFGYFMTEDTLLEIETDPGVYSDLDGTLHGDDYRFYSKALLTWQTGDDFFFKIGVRYNDVYKDAPVLPYLGFAWEISEQFRLDVLLPETAEVSWWPDPDFGVLGGIEITGASYEVRTTEALGSQRDETWVQEIAVYGGVMWRLNDAFSVALKGGAIVAGDYKWTTGQAGYDQIDGTLDPGLFLSASLGFDF